jgi:hypothetical protein
MACPSGTIAVQTHIEGPKGCAGNECKKLFDDNYYPTSVTHIYDKCATTGGTIIGDFYSYTATNYSCC